MGVIAESVLKRLESPRLYHCQCQSDERKSFSPLADLLQERTSPELAYLETKFAALVSYGLTVELLKEVLPISQDLSTTAIRQRVRPTAQRLEDELGEEQDMFIGGCQRDWDKLPDPAAPLIVGIDGGYVHKALQIVEDLEFALDLEENRQEQRKLLKAVREFETYITANRPFIPNYGARCRHGETISTAFVESAINQVLSKRFVKKQQMRWTDRGAHLLLQVQTAF